LLRQTLDSIFAATCDVSYEVIIVDDGSQDGSCDFLRGNHPPYAVTLLRTQGIGLAPARNLGMNHANGDVLVICDAHIAVLPHWLDHLAQTIREGADAVCPQLADMHEDPLPRKRLNSLDSARSGVVAAGMCGKTMLSLFQPRWLAPQQTAVEVPVLCGGCFALTRAAFEATGGYEPAFRSYGWDEEEISIKLWTFGFTLKATPHTCVKHFFRPAAPYPIHNEDVMHNFLYLAMCHYSDKRVEQIKTMLQASGATKAMARQLFPQVFSAENIKSKRELYREKRMHSDDWFFEQFKLMM
jgi:glycosyltransferase involved in cell wall biosynthesis